MFLKLLAFYWRFLSFEQFKFVYEKLNNSWKIFIPFEFDLHQKEISRGEYHNVSTLYYLIFLRSIYEFKTQVRRDLPAVNIFSHSFMCWIYCCIYLNGDTCLKMRHRYWLSFDLHHACQRVLVSIWEYLLRSQNFSESCWNFETAHMFIRVHQLRYSNVSACFPSTLLQTLASLGGCLMLAWTNSWVYMISKAIHILHNWLQT